MQIGYLTISAFVGLNPQEPVASQTIIDTSLGLVFGTWIGTVVGRVIWPVLPQRILRENLVALCIHLQALLNGDPHQEKIRGQLAMLPIEALQAVRQLRMGGCSKEEKVRVAALVRALETLVIRTSQLVSRRQLLQGIAEPKLRLQFECLEVEFKQMLEAFRKCFGQGDCRRTLPALQGALAGLDHAVQDVYNRRRFGGETSEASTLRLLDLVDRYRATAEAMEGCGRLLGSLQLQRYWGDYAL